MGEKETRTMALRDHFRPPLDNMRHWEGFHATWPVAIVSHLCRKLPHRYFAEPRIHSGTSAEIDVTIFEGEGDVEWAPPRTTLAVATNLPAQDVYEVLVYDERRRTRLVAAVEIVSPANKDRPEHRRAFASKCAGLLRERVSVVIVDVVTTRTQNLYAELLDLIGTSDPSLSPEAPLLYTVACRFTKRNNEWMLETWAQALDIGRPLPTVPLWLADNLAVPLDLHASYEESCSILNLP
jgi:Protein of unknown function (DUF4058)